MADSSCIGDHCFYSWKWCLCQCKHKKRMFLVFFNEPTLEMKVEIKGGFRKIWLDSIQWIYFGVFLYLSAVLFSLFLFNSFPPAAQKRCKNTGVLHEATTDGTNRRVSEAALNPAVLREEEEEREGDWEIEGGVVVDALVLGTSQHSTLYRAHPQAFSVIRHTHTHSYKERDTISICS